MENQLVTIITMLPLVGAAALALMARGERSNDNALRWTALLFSAATFVISLALPLASNLKTFETNVPWISAFNLGVRYHVAVDGLSLWLVMLTTFLVPLALISSWRSVSHHQREFLITLLALETGMIGVFISMDLFLFYVFWEVMLVPMYLLIGIWGGERRVYASIKFVIYTVVGSLLMLAGIIALYYVHGHATGSYTFDIVAITDHMRSKPFLSLNEQRWLFWAFAIAFLIKVPLFPFHTWLPDAHVEAPTAGSVLLAGVLLKMGTYGLMRFNLPLFPRQISSSTETHYTRKIEGAGSDPALVTAAMYLGLKPHPRLALPHKKGAHSLGTVDLMSRQRKQINPHCIDIDIQVTDRLRRIRVKKHVAFVSDATDVGDRGYSANLIVRRHY